MTYTVKHPDEKHPEGMDFVLLKLEEARAREKFYEKQAAQSKEDMSKMIAALQGEREVNIAMPNGEVLVIGLKEVRRPAGSFTQSKPAEEATAPPTFVDVG